MHPATIHRLSFLIDVVPHLFFEMDKGLIRRKPSPEKWSPIEIVGHLCDSALNNWKRFAEIPTSKTVYKIQPYQQDELVQVNDYQNAHAGNLLHLWVGLNRQIVSLWKNYTDATWRVPIVLPDSSEADLAFLVKDYVDHLEHHLKQIFTTPYDISIPKSTSEKISSENQQILQILLREGNVSVEFYQPKDKDSQQPHLQDEFYFIANGNADFDRDGSIEKVKAGDFLFVPAGEKHHFLNFSSGFSTWVVFF